VSIPHGIDNLAGFLSGLRELAESSFPKKCQPV
jgi:hypothetical protein